MDSGYYGTAYKPPPFLANKPATVRGRAPNFEEPWDEYSMFLETHANGHEPAQSLEHTGDVVADAVAKGGGSQRAASKPFRLPFEPKPPTVSITGAPAPNINGLYDLVEGEQVNGVPLLEHESGRFWLRRTTAGFWVASNRREEGDGRDCILLSETCQLAHPCTPTTWAHWNGYAWDKCPSVSVEYLWDESLREPPLKPQREQKPNSFVVSPDAPVGGGCSTLNTSVGPSAGKAGVPYHCRVLRVGGKLTNHF